MKRILGSLKYMLELKNICFSVEEDNKKKDILKDVNLVIDDSKFVAITGPNGGGKSTLAKIIIRWRGYYKFKYYWKG